MSTAHACGRRVERRHLRYLDFRTRIAFLLKIIMEEKAMIQTYAMNIELVKLIWNKTCAAGGMLLSHHHVCLADRK